jgi:hypothetical protein
MSLIGGLLFDKMSWEEIVFLKFFERLTRQPWVLAGSISG